ncbi:MAG TPA: PD-(D/E)XK nuclease-like domain-containing protein [Polyangiaceae bacterium]|nr:PD-(D/E)XK nuclease-like domain-containing protein [Polyangiaceae bacterium]
MGERGTNKPKPNAVVFGLPAAVYHSDPCEVPSLSSSVANILVSRSPLHAWHAHPRLGGRPYEPSASMDAGSVAHAVLLGTAQEELVVVDAEDWRTKAAQEARAAAREQGKCAVLPATLAEITASVDVIRKRFARYGVRFTGRSEVSLFWTEQASDGTIIQCRGRIDHLILKDGRARILDLKTARSAHPRACQSHAYEYGYDIQAAAYRSAFAKLYPRYSGREEFLWLFAELDGPNAVAPYALDGSFDWLGERRWRRAVDLWARCLREDSWPSYTDEILRLEAPQYAVALEEEEGYGSSQI